MYDIGVIGAGPCGIAAGVAARQAGLSCVLFDRGTVAHAIYRYPIHTTFFSGAGKLEVGGLPFTISGDKPGRREALRYYRRAAEYFELDVRQYEGVESVEGSGGVFELTTHRRSGDTGGYRARNVVVASGYFDTPRRLPAPGADLDKVSYYFNEPYPYYRQDVVVVGGGNSAAEAALTCWREGARVTLVHLQATLDAGIKPWVRPDLENRIEEGAIPVLWRHRVTEITPGSVTVESLDSGERRTLKNDFVLSMTGYYPDNSILRSLGVTIDEETGVPTHDPRTMRTDVPGVYLAGVVAAGLDANKIFIENGRFHGGRIVGDIGAVDARGSRRAVAGGGSAR